MFQSAKARLLLCDTPALRRVGVMQAFQSAKARLLLCDLYTLRSAGISLGFQSAKARLLLCDVGLFIVIRPDLVVSIR